MIAWDKQYVKFEDIDEPGETSYRFWKDVFLIASFDDAKYPALKVGDPCFALFATVYYKASIRQLPTTGTQQDPVVVVDIFDGTDEYLHIPTSTSIECNDGLITVPTVIHRMCAENTPAHAAAMAEFERSTAHRHKHNKHSPTSSSKTKTNSITLQKSPIKKRKLAEIDVNDGTTTDVCQNSNSAKVAANDNGWKTKHNTTSNVDDVSAEMLPNQTRASGSYSEDVQDSDVSDVDDLFEEAKQLQRDQAALIKRLVADKEKEMKQVHADNQALRNEIDSLKKKLQDVESTLQSPERYRMTNLEHLCPKELAVLSKICAENRSDIEQAVDLQQANNECIICCEYERNVVLQCGHLVLCGQCAEKMKNTNDAKCPVCNGTFNDFQKIYKS
eukprot:CAMPEP_0202703426 /NCGR_PEP_ID=MMETSP1385-20130828/16276_1 /ASSEMBLY_ACC=CAM_ASM_000861 /TAXON_ID=933848 /ORGANISM="Elphidium margaritaceum" /LENGTH=387 /DNA_ID=CAMNT_0049361279 /DNA_START=164 /DNA_END=1327 /DNA_ORIENTATION=-